MKWKQWVHLYPRQPEALRVLPGSLPGASMYKSCILPGRWKRTGEGPLAQCCWFWVHQCIISSSTMGFLTFRETGHTKKHLGETRLEISLAFWKQPAEMEVRWEAGLHELLCLKARTSERLFLRILAFANRWNMCGPWVLSRCCCPSIRCFFYRMVIKQM